MMTGIISAGSCCVVHDSGSESEGEQASLGSSTDSAEEGDYQPVAWLARGEAVPGL